LDLGFGNFGYDMITTFFFGVWEVVNFVGG
jgi:hypothetical protein